MKLELIGDIIDQPDGSGIAELDVDEEGKMYLMQLGFEYLILHGIEAIKKERADGASKGNREVGEDAGHELSEG
jgi:hypothetical protein